VTSPPVRVGLLGLGNVGGALLALLDEEGDAIAARTGVELVITRVAVRTLSRQRRAALERFGPTTDPFEVVTSPDVDVVVELIGGTEPAGSLILAALEAGKPVVTANKELLAASGGPLSEAASRAGVDLLYEAAVAGAVPLIRPLRESLAGERIQRVMGIVNGTTNYILTHMSDEGVSYGEALSEAQELGFAEADPTADVEGLDARAKAAILAGIAFGQDVISTDVYCEGITGIGVDDIGFAKRLGYEVKLLAVAELADEEVGVTAHDIERATGQEPRSQVDEQGPTGQMRASGAITVRVHPAMVPSTHPLASVRDVFNAIFIEGEAAGELMLFGRGAGGRPSASAVLGDLVDAAHNLQKGGPGRAVPRRRVTLCPIERLRSQYYVNLDVIDRPGVLAAVASVFGSHGVSIRSMEQVGLGEEAHLVFITHTALEADMRSTLDDLRKLEAVERIGGLLRVIGPE
jgi:homoserine dehydrogenase